MIPPIPLPAPPKERRRHQPHWYLTIITYCPICLHEKRSKVRQYTPKPDDWMLREQWVEQFDWCEF